MKTIVVIFGTVSKIRPIIIITFGTTDIIVHNGIIFGAGIVVGSRDRKFVPVVTCQDIVTLMSNLNDSVTNGNRIQNIVLHLVPDQAIVPHFVPDQIAVL